MAGILYLVATPIGNLGDLSPRAVETLAQADFIAAEDTRVSLRLLNHFDIRKPLVSYHEHNRAAAGPAIAERLLGGEPSCSSRCASSWLSCCRATRSFRSLTLRSCLGCSS